jgi:hypothetical protein
MDHPVKQVPRYQIGAIGLVLLLRDVRQRQHQVTKLYAYVELHVHTDVPKFIYANVKLHEI